METAPQHPRTRKGAIRAEMEVMLRDACAQGLRALVVRAGDFFGPHAPSSWVSGLMLPPGRVPKRIVTPETPGVGHAWAYLPDLAETIARLADMEQRLPPLEQVHFAGHFLPGRGMAEAVRAALGRPDLPVRGLPWLLVYLGAPFVTFLREMIEMRYLWRVPLRLENGRLRALLGEEPHTPLAMALRGA